MTLAKFLKERFFGCLSFLFSLLVSLFWTALRVNYAGISKFLGADKNQSFLVIYLPVIICMLLWLLTALSFIGLLVYPKRKLLSIITFITSILFTGAIGAVVYFGAFDYLGFILPHFYISLAVTAVILIFLLALFVPGVNNRMTVILKMFVALALILGSVFIGYQIRPNKFVCEGVVYAVEDDYQIVFSTSDNSIAWVDVDGQKFYETYAGSMKSRELIHKVVVPQEVLDKAGHYTIYAQQMIYRGAFGGYKGDIIAVEHRFYPVDSSDGIRYYTISDVHEAFDAAVETVRKAGKIDFLVVLGDVVSQVEWEKDALATSLMCNKITNGEIPVVYARGNHEIHGQYAEDFYKYVGARGEDFYYTFQLGDIRGIALDMGEDHDDDWWEYYDTAQFDAYRDEQSAFLQKCIDENYFDGCSYRMVICHIPIPFVNYRGNHIKYKPLWTSLINELNVDIVLSGHQHDLTIFEPGVVQPDQTLVYNRYFSGEEGKTYKGHLTDFSFVSFLVARRSLVQNGDTQQFKYSEYTGMLTEVDLNQGIQRCRYTNVNGEVVEVCNIFASTPPQKEFVVPLHHDQQQPEEQSINE